MFIVIIDMLCIVVDVTSLTGPDAYRRLVTRPPAANECEQARGALQAARPRGRSPVVGVATTLRRGARPGARVGARALRRACHHVTARAPGPTDRKKQHSSVISAFRARNINLPKALPVTRKPSSCSCQPRQPVP